MVWPAHFGAFGGERRVVQLFERALRRSVEHGHGVDSGGWKESVAKSRDLRAEKADLRKSLLWRAAESVRSTRPGLFRRAAIILQGRQLACKVKWRMLAAISPEIQSCPLIT